MLDEKMVGEIYNDMAKGYSYMVSKNGYRFCKDAISACTEWEKTWETILHIMNEFGYENIEGIDKDFVITLAKNKKDYIGEESISNWASDYEMELGDAMKDDISFGQKRIDFCYEYINLIEDKKELNVYNMRRAIAESYFELGDKEKGEELFKQYLEKKPTWGWGWISWSDMYWICKKAEDRENEKAINILKQALEVEGIEDKVDVQERLRDLYVDIGMDEEARAIIIDESQPEIPVLKKIKSMSVTSKPKVGRNYPCPCGSGKKYKKCCMN